jgi:zinc transporter ZupT
VRSTGVVEDASLTCSPQGFAGGVMLAASYWSLLAPAIEIAEESVLYGPDGRWAFVPAAVGFAMGAAALFGTEKVLQALESIGSGPHDPRKKDDDYDAKAHGNATAPTVANTKR